jgi:aryl-phospho-beta-D-glucosidase BglC (GH1 family)
MCRRILILLCALSALTSPAAASPLQLRRGVSIHEWLNWSPVLKPSASGDATQNGGSPLHATPYVWPPYSRSPSPITIKDLQSIRDQGFDFVRLSIDPGPMLSVSGAQRKEALKILGDAVKLALSAGLKVVFDYHPVGQVPAFSLTALNVAADEQASIAYRHMVAETAAFLKTLVPEAAQSIAIDLFNEPQFYPCDGSGGRKWQSVLSALVKATRTAAPELTLIVSGACGGGVEGLVNLNGKQLADANLLYSFHYYEPLTFTHQGTDVRKWLTNVPWPPSVRSLDQSIALGIGKLQAQAKLSSGERITAESEIRGQLQKYYAEDKGQETLDAAFAKLMGWSRANSISPEHLFMGEFGAMAATLFRGGAAEGDRLRWLTAVRQQAEKHGIGWAYWEYNNVHGMSLTNGTPKAFDPIAVQALGLIEMRHATRNQAAPNGQ